MNDNPYEILGVSKNASQEEIKKAFRKLVITNHPDKGGDPEKFKKIAWAYELLKDENKRRQYDQFGTTDEQGGSGFNGFDFRNFDFGDIFGGDFGDIFGGGFGDIFGGARGAGGSGSRVSYDVYSEVKVGLDKIYNDEPVTIKYRKQESCQDCKGTGAEKGELSTCDQCKGSGQITRTQKTPFGIFQTVSACSKCMGRGRIAKKQCPSCSGKGIKTKEESLEFKLPQEINNGESLKIEGKGNNINNRMGSLILKIDFTTSDFVKKDYDLYGTIYINPLRALIGGKEKLNILGHYIDVDIAQSTSSDDKIRIKGKGFKKKFGKGDIVLSVVIKSPEKIDSDIKKQIENLVDKI
jgi:molecular chaperone DnaJ